MIEELAVLEADLESVSRDGALVRLDGAAPEMGSEVVLSDGDREVIFPWESPRISAAIHAARQAFPRASVLTARRVTKGA